MTAGTRTGAKAAKSERSFYVTLSLAILSGLAIGVMAFGAKHPASPTPVGPVADAPKPSVADAAGGTSTSGTTSGATGSYDQGNNLPPPPSAAPADGPVLDSSGIPIR